MSELEHYGTKGMKWGVRKDRGHEGERARTRTIRKADKKYDKSLRGVSGFVKVNNAVANRINPRLDVLNSKPQYQGDLTKNPALHKKYINDYRRELQKSLDEAAKDIGTNASGTQRIHLRMVGEGLETSFEAFTEAVRHAAGDFQPARIVPEFNSNGQIVGQKFMPLEASMAQFDDFEDFLEHYGVKGMKWGKRKSRQTEPNHPDSQHVSEIHTRVKTQKTLRPLSNKELQDAITRMNLEQQYSRLSGGNEKTRVQKGKSFAVKILADSGKQVVAQTVTSQVKGLADQAVKKASQ